MALRRTRAWFAEQQVFLLMLLAFGVFNLLAIVALRPGGFIAPYGADQYYYFEIGRLAGSGQISYFNFWMEYPPLMPWMAALAYRLSLNLPPMGDQIFWFNLFFRLLLLPFNLGTLCLVYGSMNRLATRERALQVAGLWVLLFTPLFTLLSWFEPLVLFFLMLGVYGLLTDRPLLVGLGTGLGFMAKVIPIVLLPVALFSLRRNYQRILYAGSAIASAVLVILPPLLVTSKYALATLNALRNMSSWETVWALLEGYKGYGTVADLSLRTDISASNFSIHLASLPWLPITLGFALLYGFIITRRIAWEDKQRVALFSLFTVAVFMLYNKGYSPQYAVHLGTLALVALPMGQGLIYALLLDVLVVTEWPVAFIALSGQSLFLTTVIILRTALIALLGLDCLARIFEAPLWRVVRRAALPVTVLICLIGGMLSVPRAGRAYASAYLDSEPLAPLVRSLRAAADPEPIVIVQPSLLERLQPYLPGDTVQLFPNVHGKSWANVDEWLSTTLRPYDRVWLLYDGSEGFYGPFQEQMRTWFDTHACPNIQTWYGSVWAGHYVIAPVPAEQPVDVTYVNGMRLASATSPRAPLRAGKAFGLHLKWLADAPVSQDYTVFVQVLSRDGKLIAQSDVWPTVPVSRWKVGEAVTTRHGLILPTDLPAGNYVLLAGLYDQSGARLRLGDGRDAVQLAELRVESLEP